MSESSSVFVLLAIDLTPNPAPGECWVFRTQNAAESFLRGWSEDFLGGYSHDCDDLPPDAELVAAFHAAGTFVHLYRCDPDGGSSEELVPFGRAPELQA
jgi:hypothetical protein